MGENLLAHAFHVRFQIRFPPERMERAALTEAAGLGVYGYSLHVDF